MPFFLVARFTAFVLNAEYKYTVQTQRRAFIKNIYTHICMYVCIYIYTYIYVLTTPPKDPPFAVVVEPAAADAENCDASRTSVLCAIREFVLFSRAQIPVSNL